MFTKFTELRDLFDQKGVILYYQGAISHDLVVEIAGIVRRKMELDDVESSVLLRVFSAMVEQLQNILYYSAEIVTPADSELGAQEMRGGVVLVGREEGSYFVISGNLIDNVKIAPLRERLLALQGMSRDELKRHNLEQRRRDPDQGSRGAGLGIIEIARKASLPIVFDFAPAVGDTSYFFLKTTI